MGTLLSGIPKVLYKYLPPSRISVLESHEVRFTPPDEFNDPFEAYPRIGELRRESVRRRLEPGEDLDRVMSLATPFFVDNGPDMVFQMVSASFGAFSLASVADNPLLWAHYATGHRGFAIGFDSGHSWFHECDPPNPPLDDVQRVIYQRERPKVTIGESEDLSEEEQRENARAMICTKFKSWRYEREWRLIRALELADRVVEDGKGGRVHLFRFPESAVSEVILGARMSETDSLKVQKGMREGNLLGARLRKAQRSKSTFLLDLEDSEPV